MRVPITRTTRPVAVQAPAGGTGGRLGLARPRMKRRLADGIGGVVHPGDSVDALSGVVQCESPSGALSFLRTTSGLEAAGQLVLQPERFFAILRPFGPAPGHCPTCVQSSARNEATRRRGPCRRGRISRPVARPWTSAGNCSRVGRLSPLPTPDALSTGPRHFPRRRRADRPSWFLLKSEARVRKRGFRPAARCGVHRGSRQAPACRWLRVSGGSPSRRGAFRASREALLRGNAGFDDSGHDRSFG